MPTSPRHPFAQKSICPVGRGLAPAAFFAKNIVYITREGVEPLPYTVFCIRCSAQNRETRSVALLPQGDSTFDCSVILSVSEESLRLLKPPSAIKPTVLL